MKADGLEADLPRRKHRRGMRGMPAWHDEFEEDDHGGYMPTRRHYDPYARNPHTDYGHYHPYDEERGRFDVEDDVKTHSGIARAGDFDSSED